MIAHGNLRLAMRDPSLFPSFRAPYGSDDGVIAARLLKTAALSAEQDARIDRTATRLIAAIRANDDRLGGVEDMLREFALSTKEGLALMVLAEALLRVPDAKTADRFIEARRGRLRAPRDEIERVPGQCVGVGARDVGARDSARRNPARNDRAARETPGRSGGTRRDQAGDAAGGEPFRVGGNHRSRAGARGAAFERGCALFLRHARRRRTHRRRCDPLF